MEEEKTQGRKPTADDVIKELKAENAKLREEIQFGKEMAADLTIRIDQLQTERGHSLESAKLEAELEFGVSRTRLADVRTMKEVDELKATYRPSKLIDSRRLVTTRSDGSLLADRRLAFGGRINPEDILSGRVALTSAD